MNTIKSVEKNHTKVNEEIPASWHQKYQSKTIFNQISEIHIIAFFYLIFKIFRKTKINFDIKFKISEKKWKN